MALTENPDQLETLSPSGSAPSRRIKDPAKAASIVRSLRKAGEQRDRKNALIKGMFDGNPPYSEADLRRAGQAYRANFNTLEGKGLLSAALVPYYELLAGSKYMVDLHTEWGPAEDHDEISRIITEEVDRELRTWGDMETTLWALVHDFVGFGRGFLMWEPGSDWRPTHVPFHRVRVPDGTSVRLDELEVFTVSRKVPAHVLYRQSKRGRGWNQEAVVKAIRAAMPQNVQQQQEYHDVQRALRDHDLYISTSARLISQVSLFVREFDNTWTLYILDEDNKADPEFLYQRQRAAKDVRELLAPFFFEVFDGSWNGTAALGKDIYPLMQHKDRFRCSVTDATYLRNSIIVKPTSPAAADEAALVQNGPITVVSENYDLQQSTLLGDIASTLEVNRDFDQLVSVNTGIYRTRLEQPTGNPRTAEEVRLQFANSTVLSNSAVNRFYVQWDRAMETIVNRMLADTSLELHKRLKKRNVPAAALKQLVRIAASRAVGNGSLAMRQQSIQNLFPFVGMLPEGGRMNFLEDAIAVLSSQKKVDRYLPIAERQNLPTRHHWDAMIENDSFKDATPVPVTDDHNHMIHAQSHLQAAAQAAASLQQGADPAGVLSYLDTSGPHIQQHLQLLSRDQTRSQALAPLMEQWKELASLADQLRGAVEQQAQAQMEGARQEQASNGKLSLEREQMGLKMQMELEKHQQDLVLARERTQNEIEMRRLQMAAQVQEDLINHRR